MATPPEGKHVSDRRNMVNMSYDYGIRAGRALQLLLPTQDRDKTIARLFGVSVRMARYLQGGRFWTIGRLTQAGQAIAGFDAMIGSPEQILDRIDGLQRELQAIRDLVSGDK